MATYTKTKPENTCYSDYTIQNGKLYFIFEKLDNRVETIFIAETEKTLEDWKGFEVSESETEYSITL